MLVTKAMHESFHSTSPLPSPEQKTLMCQCCLTAIFNHPTGAGPMGLLAHTHVPLGLAPNP